MGVWVAGLGLPGEEVQGGESEVEGLGTEVMGGTGRSGLLVQGAEWGLGPPGETAGNGGQHHMEVGQGAGPEREAGGGEGMGLWVAGLGLPGEQGDAPQIRAQTCVGVVDVKAGKSRVTVGTRTGLWGIDPGKVQGLGTG